MVRVFYSPQYVGSAHDFETTRKAQWVADSLISRPIPAVELVSPPSLSYEQLLQVHAPTYVEAVRTGLPRDLAESQGFGWDAGLWPMVLASNGGAVAAALAALRSGVSGSLSSGLHHARREKGAGFCTFNGLVLAAREALAAGAGSVLILDFDAHCGGGTASLIAEEPRIWQLDISVDDFDSYESRERATLRMVREAGEYLNQIERDLSDVQRRGPHFDLCLLTPGWIRIRGAASERCLALRVRFCAHVNSWCSTGVASANWRSPSCWLVGTRASISLKRASSTSIA